MHHAMQPQQSQYKHMQHARHTEEYAAHRRCQCNRPIMAERLTKQVCDGTSRVCQVTYCCPYHAAVPHLAGRWSVRQLCWLHCRQVPAPEHSLSACQPALAPVLAADLLQLSLTPAAQDTGISRLTRPEPSQKALIWTHMQHGQRGSIYWQLQQGSKSPDTRVPADSAAQRAQLKARRDLGSAPVQRRPRSAAQTRPAGLRHLCRCAGPPPPSAGHIAWLPGGPESSCLHANSCFHCPASGHAGD